MGNLGKATSFVDPEGDGDVMPKLVDMLTKVGESLTIVQHTTNVFIPMCRMPSFLFHCLCFRLESRCPSSLVKVVPEVTLATMMKTGANTCASPLFISKCIQKTSCHSLFGKILT